MINAFTHRPDPAGVGRRDFLKQLAAGGALIAVGPTLAACGSSGGGSGASSSKVIGVNLPFKGADVYKPLLAGAQEEAKKLGYTILQSNSSLAAAPQLNELDTWIGEKVAGMTIYPVDVNSLGPVVKHAHANKIVVVAYGAEIPGADGSTLFNEKQGATLIGQAAAHWINQNARGKAKVALLTQNAQETSRLRVNRAVAVMKQGAPGAQIVAQAEAADPPTALKATRTILQAHPDIHAMICINDQDLIGASQAIKAAGRSADSLWLGGFDGSRQAMQLILDGKITGATAALQLKQIGGTTVSIPVNIIKKSGPTAVLDNYVLVDNSTPAVARKLIADYNG